MDSIEHLDFRYELDTTESQQELLIGVQTSFCMELDDRKTLDRAVALYSPSLREQILRYPYCAWVTRGPARRDHGSDISTAQIRFSLRPDIATGEPADAYAYISVCETIDDIALPLTGFTAADAKTVEDMVSILECMRRTGQLPDLNEYCTSIS